MMMLPLLVLFAICISVAQGHVGEAKLCRQQKEVVFMLDASRSVDNDNFAKVLNFTKIMIGLLDVRPEATRVAVVSFSTDVIVNVELGDYSSMENLQTKVGNVGYLDQQRTETGDALNVVRESVFSSDHENYTQIIICVTDGEPTSMADVTSAVNEAKAVGIHIIAIGVGRNLQAGLNALATNQSYVYSVNNFASLVTVVEGLSLQLCTTECPDKKLDLALILDRSTSVGNENFRKAINFLMHIVNRLDIGENETRVALLGFERDVSVFFDLDEYYNKAEILTQLNSTSYGNGGDTYTHRALNSAKFILTQSTGSRGKNESNKVAIVVTDGGSQRKSDTKTAADSLKKDASIIVIAIGVADDPNVQNEMVNIATPSNDSDVTYLFNMDNYDNLDDIILAVTRRTCD